MTSASGFWSRDFVQSMWYALFQVFIVETSDDKQAVFLTCLGYSWRKKCWKILLKVKSYSCFICWLSAKKCWNCPYCVCWVSEKNRKEKWGTQSQKFSYAKQPQHRQFWDTAVAVFVYFQCPTSHMSCYMLVEITNEKFCICNAHVPEQNDSPRDVYNR